MMTKGLNAINNLIKRPSFSAREARKKGVSSSVLAYYVARGQIERISRGVYRGLEGSRKQVPFEWEDLIATAQSIEKGIICLISALSIYELTDEMPRQFWIAVPNDSRPPRRPNTKIVRMRNTKIGATKIKLGEVNVRIFDRERTVVDTFRYLNKEVAIKALRRYLESKDQRPNLNKLLDYGKKLRAPITEYVEALLA